MVHRMIATNPIEEKVVALASVATPNPALRAPAARSPVCRLGVGRFTQTFS
jgi:hypothetical protein